MPQRRRLRGHFRLLPYLPPHCPNCGDDHDTFSSACGARPVPPPQPEPTAPFDKELSDASSDSEEAMDVGDDGRPPPSTPEAPPTQTIDLSTPRPAHHSKNTHAPLSWSQPAPTGRDWPPLTPYKPSGSSRKLLKTLAHPPDKDWLQRRTSPSFNTTAWVAGMCFFPYSPPLQRAPPLSILFFCKIPVLQGLSS